jgi:hypothetical protein
MSNDGTVGCVGQAEQWIYHDTGLSGSTSTKADDGRIFPGINCALFTA